MPQLHVQIVTAEREVYADDDVEMVVAPGSEGVLGILPKHASLLTTLAPGVVRIKKDGGETAMSVGGGFLQIARNRVLILADTAEREDEIDESRADQARQRAQQILAEAARGGTSVQVEAARTALRRSLARIEVARRRRRGPPTA